MFKRYRVTITACGPIESKTYEVIVFAKDNAFEQAQKELQRRHPMLTTDNEYNLCAENIEDISELDLADDLETVKFISRK